MAVFLLHHTRRAFALIRATLSRFQADPVLLRIQHESCRLPNMSLAAIYGLVGYLDVACGAMREAKRSSSFPGLTCSESNGADQPVEPATAFRCCGKTHIGQTANFKLNLQAL